MNIHGYFDSQRNQYLTPDPLGITVGDDLYAFAHNRPHEYVDLWGLAPEEYEWRYEHERVSNPRVFGSIVHTYFSEFVRSKGANEWGGNGARIIPNVYDGKATWPTGGVGTMLIDAWHVSTTDRLKENSKKPFVGSIWELKPATYKTGRKYEQAKNQVARYIKGAKRGKWQAGACYTLNVLPAVIPHGDEYYLVNFEDDYLKSPKTGLIFYSANKIQKRDSKDTLQEATESLVENGVIEKAKEYIERIKTYANQDGWNPVKVVGIAVAIALALALMYLTIKYVGIAAIIGGFLLGLRFIIQQVATGAMRIGAAIASVFGASTIANAEDLGEKEQKNTLEKWYDKFKSWLK